MDRVTQGVIDRLLGLDVQAHCNGFLTASQTRGCAGGEPCVLPVVSHLTVLLLEGDGGCWLPGGGALVTGFQEARPLGGQRRAVTLFLGQLCLRLRECQQHAALDFSHLNAWPARGAAG